VRSHRTHEQRHDVHAVQQWRPRRREDAVVRDAAGHIGEISGSLAGISVGGRARVVRSQTLGRGARGARLLLARERRRRLLLQHVSHHLQRGRQRLRLCAHGVARVEQRVQRGWRCEQRTSSVRVGRRRVRAQHVREREARLVHDHGLRRVHAQRAQRRGHAASAHEERQRVCFVVGKRQQHHAARKRHALVLRVRLHRRHRGVQQPCVGGEAQ
jgi:hypothetical protein